MKKYVSLVLINILLSILYGCGGSDNECAFQPDTADQKIHIEIEHLENLIATIETEDQLVSFFTDNPIVRDYLFGRKNYPGDSVFIKTLHQRFKHPAFDTLLIEVKRVFGEMTTLQNEFDEAFSNIKYYYPDFTPPKVKTVITGMETDLYVSDTLIVVGLDYYLGKEGKYRPHLFEYLLTRYEPEDIVPSCMLIYGIGSRNKTDLEDRTVMADMIAYGKSFYFAKHMLPCIPDSTFIWYTSEEMMGARKNMNLIWARFIEDEVLFSTSHITKQKFLSERPKTLEVGEKCPGRIAQWVGWEIVKSYMKAHPDVSLPELMDMSDSREIFKESKFRPEGK